MSALTDLFTSLANKIRTHLGTAITYTPTEAISAIDAVYAKGVSDTKVGNAEASHVLAGKTFTNSTTVGETGTMTNRGAVSQTLNTSTTSYTVPAGYHNGSGTVSITTQEGSASPATSNKTYTPDTGKVYSSFTVSAISPQRSNNTAATTTGRDSSGPYVYFPYGWWPKNSNTYGSYTRLTEAQAIAVARTQEKEVASSTSTFDVTPNTNYLLSKVTVTGLTMSGTYKPSGSNRNKSALDMGSTNTYRYVNTNVCYSYGYETAGAALTEKAFKATSAYQTYWDQTISGLSSGRVYAVLALVIQNGGTFSGVGSGAKLSCTSGGSLDAGWDQIEAQNMSTSNHGGMVMWAHGLLTASSSSATIRINTVSKLSAYWKLYVVGI